MHESHIEYTKSYDKTIPTCGLLSYLPKDYMWIQPFLHHLPYTTHSDYLLISNYLNYVIVIDISHDTFLIMPSLHIHLHNPNHMNLYYHYSVHVFLVLQRLNLVMFVLRHSLAVLPVLYRRLYPCLMDLSLQILYQCLSFQRGEVWWKMIL